jgi:hypothetical protein
MMEEFLKWLAALPDTRWNCFMFVVLVLSLSLLMFVSDMTRLIIKRKGQTCQKKKN